MGKILGGVFIGVFIGTVVYEILKRKTPKVIKKIKQKAENLVGGKSSTRSRKGKHSD